MNTRAGIYAMALSVAVLWGASFPLTKAALEFMGPSALAFLRWTISALVLALWLGWRGRADAADGLAGAGRLAAKEWRTLAWLALTGITLYYTLQNLAMRYTTATNAGVLSNLVSVFIVFIAALALRERLAAAEWLALGAAFAGSVLVSQGAGHLQLGGGGLLGDGLMVVASLFAAIYSVGAKRLLGRYPAALVTTVIAGAGALFLLPVALVEGLPASLPPAVWGILLVIGVGSGAIANLWWLTLLGRVPASRAALVLFLIPVVASALSVILLDEPLTLTLVLGTLLVLGSMALVQWRPASAG